MTQHKVIILLRAAVPGRYSLERVFHDVHAALPADIEGEIVHVPFQGHGLVPRLRNLAFTLFLRADIIHVAGDVHYCALAVRRSRCILTIPDLASLRRLRGVRRHVYFLFWFRLPVWWASRVTTISDATRRELVNELPRSAAKTFTVPCPVGEPFLEARHSPGRRDLPQVLQVGTGPNKNLERVMKAVAELPVHLRIVGPLNREQRSLLETSGLSYSAIDNLADDELVREYAESDILTFMSLYEGFGLPVVEAQALGLPVITSNISSMPEVAGSGALLVDPFDTAAIRGAVAQVLGSRDLAESLAAQGRSNARSFSAASVAASYAEIYRQMRHR